jgi:hypothetical protein
MSELRERLQEAADAAAREGRTPSVAALVRRGRRRRRRLAAGAVAAVALVVGAVSAGTDWLAVPSAPLAPPATATPTTVGGPDVSIIPDPGRVETPVGQPPGRTGRQMVKDVASELTRCQGGDPDAPKVLVAWGTAHDRTWLILAKPPRPGETWLCWANGLFEANGAGGFGKEGGPDVPLPPLRASGSQNLRSSGHWWGQVIGAVPKEATRVRVLFRNGIAPLDLEPIQSGGQFPRNFFVGFYRQPQKEQHAEWYVTRVVAYDAAGRTVAECHVPPRPGPGPDC